MPISEPMANHDTLHCPFCSTMKAASRGPIAEPTLPPTWNSDWANPCRPPDARRATRELSGWKMADPSPTNAEPMSRIQ